MLKTNQTISVIVPVYNEISIIMDFHYELLKHLKNTQKPFEIIYVDDHSTDGTYQWLLRRKDASSKKINSHQNSVNGIPSGVRVLLKKGKKGKAYSLQQGFGAAKGNVLVMIDGDLQYPPSAIPNMVAMLQNPEIDLVVAERKQYNENKVRKFLTRGFRKFFGKTLFGLDTDIQSGLKAFTKEVYRTIKFEPNSGWTFDLEFLHRARQAGFGIKGMDIVFEERKKGDSKVNIVNQILEIGSNALYVKSKKLKPFVIPPETKENMAGAGIGYKKKKYVTHTTLPYNLSAIKTFSLTQKIVIWSTLLLIAVGLVTKLIPTLQTIVAVLSILYFIDTFFNLFMIFRSLKKQEEITVSQKQIESLHEKSLPIYTILCPLYKEAHVVPQFVTAITALDWPKEKLDVMLLLEEDDVETIVAINQMDLPAFVRIVVVPHSMPKTKPKACNYGLAFARGEYLVIYDAEDIPDVQQLKKAYIGFQNAPENVKCLQAKLNFYNARQNWLTRFFTAEYSLWFDLTLTGLQSFNSTLPLGGTSNHFKTQNLRDLQGWDPFNVTEDADLGIRLFQRGYRTAIIDSTTLEEATSVTKNWLRQRSRWLKGYMQTYLVHMRNMHVFLREKGPLHNIVFQMTIGGKILFILINPLMWIITMIYFAFYNSSSQFIQAVYQPPISYLAVFSWVFGNFLFLYYYMIGIGKRNEWDIMKYVFLIPYYWALMSIAAGYGLYQLILKPHYWEKTLHGFHISPALRPAVAAVKPKQNVIPAIPVGPAFAPAYAPSSYAQATFMKGGRADVVAAQSQNNPVMPQVKAAFKQKHIEAFMNTSLRKKVSVFKLRTIFTRNHVPPLVRALPFIVYGTLDLILAQRFLHGTELVDYVLLSLFAKAIFAVSLLAGYSISHKFLAKKKSDQQFYNLLFFTFLAGWIGFVVFGLQANIVVPALFGSMFNQVIPYMPFYLFAALTFAIASVFAYFRINERGFSFSFGSTLMLLAQIPFAILLPHTVETFVKTSAFIGTTDLMLMIVLQVNAELVRILENNISSLLGLWKQDNCQKAWHNKNLRILIFNWRDTKHIYAGGAEVYVQELAKRWVKDGNKVTIFCGNDNNNREYDTVDGVEIIRRGGTYTVYFFAMVYYLFKLRRYYDVIIDCENGIPFFTPIFSRKPIVLLIHHVHQEIFRIFLKFPMNIIAALLEGKIMPFVYRNKQIVTVSNSSQQEIFKLGLGKSKKVDIIYNGVDEFPIESYTKTAYPSFTYIGRLKEYKNIDVAIKAFADVVKKYSASQLIIAGSGESFPELKKLATELGLDNNITFTGRVSEEVKHKLLAESWAVLQPSRMEGWGITVIEANAARTPVIASNVNGLKDSVVDGETGLLVPAGNVVQFAAAMKLIAANYEFREQLSAAAYNWAKQFKWDISADSFYRVIGQSIGGEATAAAFNDLAVISDQR